MSAWHSLYVFTSLSLKITLSDWLTQHGYSLYDPFNTLGGTAYSQTLRLFLAPALEDSVRILVDGGPLTEIIALAADLSHSEACLSVRLDGTSAQIVLYHERQETNDWMSIARRGVTLPHLQAARQFTGSTQVSGVIPIEDMPSGLRAMAQSVSQHQVGRLFQKMAQQVMNRSQQSAAEQFLQGLPRWDSADGQMLMTFMALLRVPRTWRETDFTTLRTAYWLHLRRQTQPRSPLLPGDEVALHRVPDALTYTPLYGGKA